MIFWAPMLGACLVNDALVEKRRAELADDDGDGVAAEFDCDDGDNAIFPGADERCNGLDDDCDDAVDEDPVDEGTWYPDADGDSFGTATGAVTACEAPGGHVATTGDCDDDDAGAWPGAAETAYDGIDQDCDGADLEDVDGDGVTAIAVGGTDCDDGDATISPGATDACLDEVDQDCDGADNLDCDGDGVDAESAGGDDCDDADATVYLGAAEGWHDLGADNDCDGRIDDPVELSLAEADVKLLPPSTGGYTGSIVGSLPDFDGDGVAEVWMAAPYDNAAGGYGGAVYVLPSGAIPTAGGSVELEGEAARIVADAPSSYLGSGVTTAEVDGAALLLVGAPGVSDGAGVVWALDEGAVSALGVAATTDVAVALVRGEAGAFVGVGPVADQDVDGDGRGDLFLETFATGEVFGFSGPSLTEHTLADADWTFGPVAADRPLIPYAIGDLDDDGYTDLALADSGAAEEDLGVSVLGGGAGFGSVATFGDDRILGILGGTIVEPMTVMPWGDRALVLIQWQASVFLEPEVGGQIDPLVDADYQLFRTVEETAFNRAVVSPWLGSAGPALAIGSPDAVDGTAQGECVVWQTDELDFGVFSSDVQLRIVGDAPGDRACSGLSLVDDYDHDGDGDLLIGAPLADGGGAEMGMAYIQFAP